MAAVEALQQLITERLGAYTEQSTLQQGQITIQIAPKQLKTVAKIIKDDPDLYFEQLMDICGVDYQDYGKTEWLTDKASGTGFERAANRSEAISMLPPMPARFAAVYHFLSTKHNHRLRIKAFLDNEEPIISSLIEFWPSANWFEREAFDLYGIFFDGHPDLRRILTDYGFIGHPFRKDFPLIGQVEMRYDARAGRVVYEPVSISPRTLVPRVIRDDSRYVDTQLNLPVEESKK